MSAPSKPTKLHREFLSAIWTNTDPSPECFHTQLQNEVLQGEWDDDDTMSVLLKYCDKITEKLKAENKKLRKTIALLEDGKLPREGDKTPLTKEDLAESLGWFWNAALSAAIERQDSTAIAIIGALCEGVEAVKRSLETPPPTQETTDGQ